MRYNEIQEMPWQKLNVVWYATMLGFEIDIVPTSRGNAMEM